MVSSYIRRKCNLFHEWDIHTLKYSKKCKFSGGDHIGPPWCQNGRTLGSKIETHIQGTYGLVSPCMSLKCNMLHIRGTHTLKYRKKCTFADGHHLGPPWCQNGRTLGPKIETHIQGIYGLESPCMS